MRNVLLAGAALLGVCAIQVSPASAAGGACSPGNPCIGVGGHHGGWGGGWRGGERHHGDHGFGAGVAGLAAGALIGGAIASQTQAYYPYQPYYNEPYAAPSYDYMDSEPQTYGGDAYCARRFRSYDPASGTYFGYDGMRHPCP